MSEGRGPPVRWSNILEKTSHDSQQNRTASARRGLKQCLIGACTLIETPRDSLQNPKKEILTGCDLERPQGIKIKVILEGWVVPLVSA